MVLRVLPSFNVIDCSCEFAHAMQFHVGAQRMSERFIKIVQIAYRLTSAP